MKKRSITVEGFKITAWVDAAGLMRMEIKSTRGKEVLHNLDTPWENAGGALDRIAFTDNAAVIDYITGSSDAEDSRTSPALLRICAKDPIFLKWFSMHGGGIFRDPVKIAERIEADRRSEGRDPETGAMMPNVRAGSPESYEHTSSN